MSETVKEHPFEKTLGPGPYRFLGSVEIRKPTAFVSDNYKACYESAGPRFVRGMGTCAHCNTAIMNVFFVQIGSGDVYGVGCDCILKVGMAPKEIAKVNLEIAKRRKEQRAAIVAKERAELRGLLGSEAVRLRQLPHPKPRPWAKEETLYDYALWMATYSGAAGRKKALVLVKKELHNQLQK